MMGITMKRNSIVGLCSTFALMGGLVFSSTASAMVPTDETDPIVEFTNLSSSFDTTIDGSQEKQIYGEYGEVIGTLSLEPIEMENDVVKTYEITLSDHGEVIRSMTWELKAVNDTKGAGVIFIDIENPPSVVLHPGYTRGAAGYQVKNPMEDPLRGHPMQVILEQHVFSLNHDERYSADIDVQGSSGTLYLDFELVRH
ncbi:hypothetical protein [Jeotgalibacillus marinus]|uniref:Uncharacterized protein n=1 Tax=Jeotgalibacillus marinus TaxID=86667 RepID=A0ABV3Q5J6_9BACL